MFNENTCGEKFHLGYFPFSFPEYFHSCDANVWMANKCEFQALSGSW